MTPHTVESGQLEPRPPLLSRSADRKCRTRRPRKDDVALAGRLCIAFPCRRGDGLSAAQATAGAPDIGGAEPSFRCGFAVPQPGPRLGSGLSRRRHDRPADHELGKNSSLRVISYGSVMQYKGVAEFDPGHCPATPCRHDRGRLLSAHGTEESVLPLSCWMRAMIEKSGRRHTKRVMLTC